MVVDTSVTRAQQTIGHSSAAAPVPSRTLARCYSSLYESCVREEVARFDQNVHQNVVDQTIDQYQGVESSLQVPFQLSLPLRCSSGSHALLAKACTVHHPLIFFCQTLAAVVDVEGRKVLVRMTVVKQELLQTQMIEALLQTVVAFSMGALLLPLVVRFVHLDAVPVVVDEENVMQMVLETQL